MIADKMKALVKNSSAIRAMFEEGKEAAFFSNNEELLDKCSYYLAHEQERAVIAELGLKRCIASDYSNRGMIRNILKAIYGS